MERGGDRELEFFDTMFYCSNDHNDWDWASGTWNFLLVSHVGSKVPCTWAIFLCFARQINRDPNQKEKQPGLEPALIWKKKHLFIWKAEGQMFDLLVYYPDAYSR